MVGGVLSGGLYFSNDYGKTYILKFPIVTGMDGIVTMVYIFGMSHSGQYMLAINVVNSGYGTKNIIVSRDFGVTWSDVDITCNVGLLVPCSSKCISDDGSIMLIGVRPISQFEVIGSSPNLYISKNFGVTWTPNYPELSTANINAHVGTPSCNGSGTVLMCGLYLSYYDNRNVNWLLRSDDLGTTWQRCDTGTDIPIYALQYMQGIGISDGGTRMVAAIHDLFQCPTYLVRYSDCNWSWRDSQQSYYDYACCDGLGNMYFRTSHGIYSGGHGLIFSSNWGASTSIEFGRAVYSACIDKAGENACAAVMAGAHGDYAIDDVDDDAAFYLGVIVKDTAYTIWWN
jgi:hypothetical protein